MTNRHTRRAAEKTAPKCPNISGIDEACANCRFASEPMIEAQVIKALTTPALKAGQPAPQQMPVDERFCFRYPNQIAKKVWGWCGEWQARAK